MPAGNPDNMVFALLLNFKLLTTTIYNILLMEYRSNARKSNLFNNNAHTRPPLFPPDQNHRVFHSQPPDPPKQFRPALHRFPHANCEPVPSDPNCITKTDQMMTLLSQIGTSPESHKVLNLLVAITNSFAAPIMCIEKIVLYFLHFLLKVLVILANLLFFVKFNISVKNEYSKRRMDRLKDYENSFSLYFYWLKVRYRKKPAAKF